MVPVNQTPAKTRANLIKTYLYTARLVHIFVLSSIVNIVRSNPDDEDDLREELEKPAVAYVVTDIIYSSCKRLNLAVASNAEVNWFYCVSWQIFSWTRFQFEIEHPDLPGEQKDQVDAAEGAGAGIGQVENSQTPVAFVFKGAHEKLAMAGDGKITLGAHEAQPNQVSKFFDNPLSSIGNSSAHLGLDKTGVACRVEYSCNSFLESWFP